jgi:hypothetical protein
VNDDLGIPGAADIRCTLTDKLRAWCVARIVEQDGSYSINEIMLDAAPDAKRNTVAVLLERLEAEGVVGSTVVARKPRIVRIYHRPQQTTIGQATRQEAEAWRAQQEADGQTWALGDLADATGLPRRVAAELVAQWERSGIVQRDRQIGSSHAVFGCRSAIAALCLARATARLDAERAKAAAVDKMIEQALPPDLRGASVWAWGGR